MPSKKKKYNARFPAGRIKKIMQSDEEVGKVAQAVPIIISRTLELFVESMLTKTLKITNARNAKTLSPSHMKQCIMAESQFDFLRELVKNVPDINVAEEQLAADDYTDEAAIPPPAQTNNTGHSNGSGAATSSGTNMNCRLFKQYSLDATTMRQTMNFYGSALTEPTSPINYSMNGRSKADDKPPPPKLLRIESTPASLQSSSTASPAATASPRFVPVTSTKLSSTAQPIINFDFSQFPIMQSTPSPSSSSSSSPSASTPSTGTTVTNANALSKTEIQSQSVKVIQRQTSVNKAQTAKPITQPSSIASSTITSNTSIPVLSNTASSPASTPTPHVVFHSQLSTVSNTNTLEMDEDYDNL